MKTIKEFYLHNISGPMTISLPEQLKIIHASYKKDSNGFEIHYENNDEAPKTIMNLYVLELGSMIPAEGNHIFSFIGNGKCFHIYQEVEIDIQQIVYNAILKNFESEAVEQNLSKEARLKDDLKLTSEEVYRLGLIVEKDWQLAKMEKMGRNAGQIRYSNLPGLTDDQIIVWEKVQDIINTITSISI